VGAARRVRIGVVTDTHVGEHLPGLPAAVPRALGAVDLIIHAGDLTLPGVQADLERIAPVVAVRGNHDEDAGQHHLPGAGLVRVGRWRIGVTHGTRSRVAEHVGGIASLVRRRAEMPGFDRAVRGRFGAVDAIVVGHLHMPIARMVRGALLFSPGAVYVPERDPWFDWSTARGRAYRRFRALVPEEARQPAVGLLEIGPAGLRARRVLLDGPLRALRAGPEPRAGASGHTS